AVQDQVRADVRRADVCFGAELLPAVHEQHEPAVPLLGHLDLVHGAAEPPEVGPRARQRLEGGIAECDALGFLAERHGRWDGPWYRSGAQRGADECLSHSGGTGRAPAPPRPHTPTTPTPGRSRRRPGGDRYQSESWAWTFSAAPLMARGREVRFRSNAGVSSIVRTQHARALLIRRCPAPPLARVPALPVRRYAADEGVVK